MIYFHHVTFQEDSKLEALKQDSLFFSSIEEIHIFHPILKEIPENFISITCND